MTTPAPRRRPVPWLVLAALVVAFLVLAARPAGPQPVEVDAGAPPEVIEVRPAAAVWTPATVAPAVVTEVPPAPEPATPTSLVRIETEAADLVVTEGVEVEPAPEPEPVVEAAPAVDPELPPCPRDGTTYTAGSCVVAPGTMPGDPSWTSTAVCPGQNHEQPGDFSCDYDPETWSCETTHYSTCHPNEPAVEGG